MISRTVDFRCPICSELNRYAGVLPQHVRCWNCKSLVYVDERGQVRLVRTAGRTELSSEAVGGGILGGIIGAAAGGPAGAIVGLIAGGVVGQIISRRPRRPPGGL